MLGKDRLGPLRQGRMPSTVAKAIMENITGGLRVPGTMKLVDIFSQADFVSKSRLIHDHEEILSDFHVFRIFSVKNFRIKTRPNSWAKQVREIE